MNHASTASFVVTALLATPVAHADEWKHEFVPYLWGSAMDGTAGVGAVEAEVSVGFDEILDNLEMAFLGAYRATKGPLSLGFDVVYMGLGQSAKGPGGLVTADIDMDQTAIEGTVGWALTEQLVAFGGLRYVDVSAEVRARSPLGDLLAAEDNESWVDPIIGAHYTVPFSEAWSLALRGDIGGFGVVGAYRYVDMDYADGSGTGYFKYDMTISRPVLGIAFTF